jgi:hypothetical protein
VAEDDKKQGKKASALLVTLEPCLLRDRDAAAFLGISVSELGKRVRSREIAPVKIPGIRATRFRLEDVRALADRWCGNV